jgi:hypothetical protein
MLIDDEKLKEISELLKKPIKEIRPEGPMTIIEFEDGSVLPLYGGGAELFGLKDPIYSCSFCGNEQTDENPLVSLNEQDDPLICSKCAAKAVESFIQHGIEIELDIPNISPEMIKQIEKEMNKDKE